MNRNQKPLSIAALAETFEGLAEKFNSSATLLAKENSLDSPRHEVDMIYAVQAGTCLLKALDQGFLESGDPPAWDLRAHKQRELWEMRCDIAERRDSLKRIRERAAKTSIYSHDRDEVFAELKKLERVPIESQQQVLDELQRNVESFLDPQATNWPLTATSSWQAFIRLELIPQNASRFRWDCQEHLPAELFSIFGDEVFRRLSAEPITKSNDHGKADDERVRYLVRARADINATGCLIVAEMLRAEMLRRQLEIGEPRQIGQRQERVARIDQKTPNAVVQLQKNLCRLDVQKAQGSERSFKIGRKGVTLSPACAKLFDAFIELKNSGEPATPTNLMTKLSPKYDKDRKRFENDKGRFNDALKAAAIAKGLYVVGGVLELCKPPKDVADKVVPKKG